MILAINTAQRTHELALIENGEILAEETWPANKDDVDKLTLTLRQMLEQSGMDKSEIKEILVVAGPGSYTAVRTGVAFANALSEGLGAKLHHVSTFDLLRKKAAKTDPTIVVLPAGGMDVGVNFNDETKVGPLAELLADFPHDNSVHIVSELNEAQETELHSIALEKDWKEVKGHELQTIAETLLTFGIAEFPSEKIVDVIYLKDPKITKSDNPWKQ